MRVLAIYMVIAIIVDVEVKCSYIPMKYFELFRTFLIFDSAYFRLLIQSAYLGGLEYKADHCL